MQLSSTTNRRPPSLRCMNVHFTMDTAVLTSSKMRMEDPDYGDLRDMKALRERANRIAAARAQQRDLALLGGTKYHAVIVIDIDVEIPCAKSIKEALHHLQRYDVICSNSFEINEDGKKQTYDTFPLVTSSGQHMFPKFFLAGPEQMLGYAPLDGRPSQEEFFRVVAETAGVYPVRSCFGGLAIYRYDAWALPQCTYNTGPSL